MMNKANRWLFVTILVLCLCGLLLTAKSFEMKRSYEEKLFDKQTELNVLNDQYRKAIAHIELLNKLVEVEVK